MHNVQNVGGKKVGVSEETPKFFLLEDQGLTDLCWKQSQDGFKAIYRKKQVLDKRRFDLKLKVVGFWGFGSNT